MRGSDRIFLLLDLLAAQPRQSLTDLANRAELPKPTVLRFLRTLESPGWATRDASSRYSLGPMALVLARKYLSGTSVVAAAAAPMQALRDQLRETISLSARAGDRRVCVQEFPSPEPLRHVHEIGAQAPLHAGASGRVLLAYMPDDARTRIINGTLSRFTLTTVTDPAVLEPICQGIRDNGYALSLGEKTEGSVAVAVPVPDPRVGSVFSLAVFAPEVRFDADRDLEPWTHGLIECATTIEQTIEPWNEVESAAA